MKSHTVQTNTYRCQFYDNGVIYFLSTTDSQNLIPDDDGWGCEIGNWYEFFSQLKHERRSNLKSQTAHEAVFNFEVSLGTEQWQVTETLIFDEATITQRFEFVVVSKTARLGDLVNRFVFTREPWSSVKIDGKGVEHNNTNIYYQTKVSDVTLENETSKFTITSQETVMPSAYDKAFNKVLYLRDEPQKKWIVHHRFIATDHAAGDYVARWFYPNNLLPAPIARWLSSDFWRAFWWRARERMPLSPINLGGIIYVAKGDKFILTDTLKLTQLR